MDQASTTHSFTLRSRARLLRVVLAAVICVCPLLARAQVESITTRIQATLDVRTLDTTLIEEPYATALREASTATLSVTYPPGAWSDVFTDPLAIWATYWTFPPASMGYWLEVDGWEWSGVNTGPPADPAHAWSRVTYGSFAAADGSIAYRVSVGDGELSVQFRSEQLTTGPQLFNLPFGADQSFPSFAEDLTAAYAERLVVEIQGLGPVSVLFTGSAFAHGEPVLDVVVEPSRSVTTQSSSWGAVKALFH